MTEQERAQAAETLWMKITALMPKGEEAFDMPNELFDLQDEITSVRNNVSNASDIGSAFSRAEADNFGEYMYCGHDDRGVKVAPIDGAYNPLFEQINDGYMSYEDFARESGVDVRPNYFDKTSFEIAENIDPASIGLPENVLRVWKYLGLEARCAALATIMGLRGHTS